MSSNQYYSQKELVEQAIEYMSTIQKQLSEKTHISQNEVAAYKNIEELNKILIQGLNKYHPNTKTN